MPRFRLLLACSLILGLPAVILPATAAPAAAAPAQAAVDLDGAWGGALDAGGTKLETRFHFRRGGDGTWGGTMDVPLQGAKDIPVPEVLVDGANVRFEVPAIRGRFEGVLSADGRTLTGKWHQGWAALPLVLTRDAAPVALSRPQTPRPPFPYRSEDVTYPGARAGLTLAGTLTLPHGEGPLSRGLADHGLRAAGPGRDHPRPQAHPRPR